MQVIEHRGLARGRVDPHQPAILVVRRPYRRHRDRAIVGQHRHAPAELSRLLLGAAGFGQREPRRLARLQIQHGQHHLVLDVADLGPPGQVADVAGFGDVIGDIRGLGRFGAFGDDGPHVLAGRIELQIRGGLAGPQFELGERLLLAARLVPLALPLSSRARARAVRSLRRSAPPGCRSSSDRVFSARTRRSAGRRHRSGAAGTARRRART